jgi:hypothetical protein
MAAAYLKWEEAGKPEPTAEEVAAYEYAEAPELRSGHGART